MKGKMGGGGQLNLGNISFNKDEPVRDKLIIRNGRLA